MGSEMCIRDSQRWETAANSAPDGVRVATLRTGHVVSSFGGMLGKERPFFQFGLGGKIRDGSQYMSWISLHDHVSAMMKVLTDDAMSGPVNLVSPNPCTNAEFTTALAQAMHRPSVIPFPVPAAKMIFGSQLVDEALCSGQRVKPCLLYTSPSPRDLSTSRMPSSA